MNASAVVTVWVLGLVLLGGGMRVTFKPEGGLAYLPGLNKPTIIDTAELTETEEERLVQLLERARFFSLPSRVGAPAPGAADYQQYTITVSDGIKQHTVHISGESSEPNLQNLLEYLRKQAASKRK